MPRDEFLNYKDHLAPTQEQSLYEAHNWMKMSGFAGNRSVLQEAADHNMKQSYAAVIALNI